MIEAGPVEVVAAAIVRDGRVLAARRAASHRLAGGWEFPGGKVEPGETPAAALVRECREELAVDIAVGDVLGSADGDGIRLTLWDATLVAGQPQHLEDHDQLRWVTGVELDDLAWLPVDRVLLPAVARMLARKEPEGHVVTNSSRQSARPAGEDMDTVSFDSHGTRCEGWYLQALNDDLTTSRGRPCVVMAHGFGATRDAGLLPFAERFCAAGMDVLVFDYRGFGTSEGEPRQDVDHRRHREDYHAAIAWVRARKGVDAARIALWGTSYSGGHVVVVAATDQRVAAVISQGAAMDGLAALVGNQKSDGPAKAAANTAAALRDSVGRLLGREPVLLPIVGPPGSGAVISAADAEEGYQAIAGPTFRNEMLARGLLRVPRNRPVRAAARVSCPMLVVVAELDNIAPVSAVHEAARRAPRAEVLSFPANHFEIYVGEVFEKSSTEQVEFLRRVLA